MSYITHRFRQLADIANMDDLDEAQLEKFHKNVNIADIHSHAKLLVEATSNATGSTPPIVGPQCRLGVGLRTLIAIAPCSAMSALASISVHSGAFPPLRWEVCTSKKTDKPLSLNIVPGEPNAGAYFGSWFNQDWIFPAELSMNRKDVVVPLYAKVAAIYIYLFEEKDIMEEENVQLQLLPVDQKALPDPKPKKGGVRVAKRQPLHMPKKRSPSPPPDTTPAGGANTPPPPAVPPIDLSAIPGASSEASPVPKSQTPPPCNTPKSLMSHNQLGSDVASTIGGGAVGRRRWKFSGVSYAGPVAAVCTLLMPTAYVASLVTFGSPPFVSTHDMLFPFPHTHIQHFHDLTPHVFGRFSAHRITARVLGLGYLVPDPPAGYIVNPSTKFVIQPSQGDQSPAPRVRGAKELDLYRHMPSHVMVLTPSNAQMAAGEVMANDSKRRQKRKPAVAEKEKQDEKQARDRTKSVLSISRSMSQIGLEAKSDEKTTLLKEILKGDRPVTEAEAGAVAAYERKLGNVPESVQGLQPKLLQFYMPKLEFTGKVAPFDIRSQHLTLSIRDYFLPLRTMLGKKIEIIPIQAAEGNQLLHTFVNEKGEITNRRIAQDVAHATTLKVPPKPELYSQETMSVLELLVLQFARIVNAARDSAHKMPISEHKHPPVSTITYLELASDNLEGCGNFLKQFRGYVFWDPERTARQLFAWGPSPPLHHFAASYFVKSQWVVFACAPHPKRPTLSRHLTSAAILQGMAVRVRELLLAEEGYHFGWTVGIASTVHGVGKSTLIRLMNQEVLQTTVFEKQAVAEQKAAAEAAAILEESEEGAPVPQPVLEQRSPDHPQPQQQGSSNKRRGPTHATLKLKWATSGMQAVADKVKQALAAISQSEKEAEEAVESGEEGDLSAQVTVHNTKMTREEFIEMQKKHLQKKKEAAEKKREQAAAALNIVPSALMLNVQLEEIFYDGSPASENRLALCSQVLWIVNDVYTLQHLIDHGPWRGSKNEFQAADSLTSSLSKHSVSSYASLPSPLACSVAWGNNAPQHAVLHIPRERKAHTQLKRRPADSTSSVPPSASGSRLQSRDTRRESEAGDHISPPRDQPNHPDEGDQNQTAANLLQGSPHTTTTKKPGAGVSIVDPVGGSEKKAQNKTEETIEVFRVENLASYFCLNKGIRLAFVDVIPNATSIAAISASAQHMQFLQRLILQWIVPVLPVPIDPKEMPKNVELGNLFIKNPDVVEEYLRTSTNLHFMPGEQQWKEIQAQGKGGNRFSKMAKQQNQLGTIGTMDSYDDVDRGAVLIAAPVGAATGEVVDYIETEGAEATIVGDTEAGAIAPQPVQPAVEATSPGPKRRK